MLTAAIVGLFAVIAFFELLGSWLLIQSARDGWDLSYLLSGLGSLLVFGYLLTVPLIVPGRLFLIYGCIYILGSFIVYLFVDKVVPDIRDIVGMISISLGLLLLLLRA